MTNVPLQTAPAAVLARVSRASSGTARAFTRACTNHCASASADAACSVTLARSGQMLLDAARAGDADAQYWMSTQLRASAACNPQARPQVWLEHAAQGGNPAAQVIEAEQLSSCTRLGTCQATRAPHSGANTPRTTSGAKSEHAFHTFGGLIRRSDAR